VGPTRGPESDASKGGRSHGLMESLVKGGTAKGKASGETGYFGTDSGLKPLRK